MRHTPVFIVCSPRPMVGKTLLARLLSEFLLLKNGAGAVAAFDINLKEPSLLEYVPDITETAEVDTTFGQMALMDRVILNDGIAKVIDLGFHAFDEFFKMSEGIGFLKEAARRGVSPLILFVADTDRVSARGHAMLLQQIPPSALVTIDNEYVVRGELPAAMARGRVLRIRALPAFLKTYIDRLNFSFTDYLRNEKDSSTELHQWVRRNYFGFRELELKLILQRLASSSRRFAGTTGPLTALAALPGRSMPVERHQRSHRHVHRPQFRRAAEIRQVDDEAGRDHVGADLAHQLHRALRGTAGGDEIVDQNDALAGKNGVGVHFHLVETVFQRIGDAHRGMRQLALLADRHKAGRDLMRHRAADDEAARLDAGDLVDLVAGPGLHQLIDRAAKRRAHRRAAW